MHTRHAYRGRCDITVILLLWQHCVCVCVHDDSLPHGRKNDEKREVAFAAMFACVRHERMSHVPITMVGREVCSECFSSNRTSFLSLPFLRVHALLQQTLEPEVNNRKMQFSLGAKD